MHHALYVRCREQAEREASPTAAILDSQSVKSAEKGGAISIRPGLTAASSFVTQARSALGSLPALRLETASFWNWLSDTKPKGRTLKLNAYTLTTTMNDGSIVLGNVEIKGRRVSLMVNSQARAVRGQAMLEVALSGLVRAPLTERADLDQMLAAQRGAMPQPSAMSPDEERAAHPTGIG